MMSILPIAAFTLFGVSVVGIVYSLIKKKKSGLWIGLLVVSIVLPFNILLAFGEKNEKTVDEYGKPLFVEPVVEESGIIHLQTGDYFVSKHLPAGTNDASVDAKFSDILHIGEVGQAKGLTQRLGLSGIMKVRLSTEEGDELRLSDQMTLTPAEQPKPVYEERVLYPGTWFVSKDITPGRYTIMPTTDTVGEVKIYEEDGRQVANGKLGKGQEPPAIHIDLLEGYRIEITNMNFNLLPTKE